MNHLVVMNFHQLVVLCVCTLWFSSSLVVGWHQVAGANDAYPLAADTPGPLVAEARQSGRAIPLQDAARNADCVTVVRAFHTAYGNSAQLAPGAKMLGAMIVDAPPLQGGGAGLRTILVARSGVQAVGQDLAAIGVITNANGWTYVDGHRNTRQGYLCAWARETKGVQTRNPFLGFTAHPQLPSRGVVYSTPDWEYTWLHTKGDAMRKVSYRPEAWTEGARKYHWNEEVGNAIGNCAGTKLSLEKPAGTIRCMAEMWYSPPGVALGGVGPPPPGPPSGVRSYPHLGGVEHATERYFSGDLVPSCATCQGVIPSILDGTLDQFIQANNNRLGELVCRDNSAVGFPQNGQGTPAARKNAMRDLHASRAVPDANCPLGICTFTVEDRLAQLGRVPARKISGGQRISNPKTRFLQKSLQPSV